MTVSRKTTYSSTDRAALLQRLAEVAPPIIDRICKPGPHCVLSSAVGQMVLDAQGIVALPYVAELTIANAAFNRWAREDYPGGAAEQIRRGAYWITNRPTDRDRSFTTVQVSKPWDGHLALRVGDYLLDLNLGAFNRPQHQIALPEAAVFPLDANQSVAGRFTDGATTTTVMYRPLDAPYKNDYQTAKDWTRRGRYYDVVQAILRAI